MRLDLEPRPCVPVGHTFVLLLAMFYSQFRDPKKIPVGTGLAWSVEQVTLDLRVRCLSNIGGRDDFKVYGSPSARTGLLHTAAVVWTSTALPLQMLRMVALPGPCGAHGSCQSI